MPILDSSTSAAATSLVDSSQTVIHRRRESNEQGSASVVAYYEGKTESILRRYGPGPRVHFHAGFLDKPETSETVEQLQHKLHESQERMLRDAADVWDLHRIAFREILDVGCGLGGPAIFWAEEFGSDVIAITIAPSHIDLVAKFSAEAGVSSRVHPLLCDALKLPGNERFDAIMALDSSSCLSRRPWFRRAAELLRRGRHLFIADCFLDREAYREPFDRHWCAGIGTFDEYVAAAREAGLIVEQYTDVSRLAANFWATTAALIRLESPEAYASPHEVSKAHESLSTHSLMREGLLDGGLRHMLISFRKPS